MCKIFEESFDISKAIWVKPNKKGEYIFKLKEDTMPCGSKRKGKSKKGKR